MLDAKVCMSTSLTMIQRKEPYMMEIQQQATTTCITNAHGKNAKKWVYNDDDPIMDPIYNFFSEV